MITNNMNLDTNKIQVLSYNILAKLLCTESNFSKPYYNPDDVLFENRYMRMWQMFDKYIIKKYVFCLQEVDTETSCKLQLDFKKKGYDFYFHAYGQTFNGYMGIAIAVPSEFNVINVDKFRIGDGKKWPKYNNQSFYGADLINWLSLGYIDYTKKNYGVYNNSKNRWNFMITIELELTNTSNNLPISVLISTLHMPCAFRNPSTMITYSALAMKHIQKLSNNNSKPYILAGDFNITQKNHNLYKLLTTGKCDESQIENDFPPEDTWRPNKCNIKPMKSAIKEYMGEEPLWTNYCINGVFGMTEPFKETIDYIMLSNHFTVTDAFKEPDNDQLCPNWTEPSDHILIWSVLELNYL
jgi:exonuclease III